jgi:MFS family permease
MATALEAQAFDHRKRLFWGCFIAILATAFGFIARVLTAGQWGAEFGLSETQVGEILGAGLWPFAITIVLFSLVLDRIGYKVAMWFGLICHTISTVMILMAHGYEMMYAGTFILSLGSGAVEAYANPLVATVFTKDKTKWINRLHGGWAGGLVLGGIMAVLLGPNVYWKYKIAIILIPTVVYLAMLATEKFPSQERVTAGISYRDMLREAGAVGMLIASAIIIAQIGQVLSFPAWLDIALIAVVTGVYWYFTRSLGRALFIFFLLIMILSAITELGVDSWITSLMTPEMAKVGMNAGWVLIYTSAIMLVLRFLGGSIATLISPLGLLVAGSAICAIGLFAMSTAAGVMILVAATLYGIGKAFFWPTTLAIVADQFPRGGALTMNTIGGVGMLAVGIIGAPFMGYLQDTHINANLAVEAPALQAQVMEQKSSIFGDYQAVNPAVAASLPAPEQAQIAAVSVESQKDALRTIAFLPVIMFVCYLILSFYFRSRGGYRPAEMAEGSVALGHGPVSPARAAVPAE